MDDSRTVNQRSLEYNPGSTSCNTASPLNSTVSGNRLRTNLNPAISLTMVQRESSRLFFKNGLSANASKGFLFCRTRVTSFKQWFKQTASRISRLTALFEPRQTSAALCVQSKSVTANFPRAGSVSPSLASVSSVPYGSLKQYSQVVER